MDSDVVGLGRYWAAVRRRRWVVVACVVLFAGGFMAYVHVRPGSYEATAQVLLKPYSTSKFSEVPLTTGQVDTQVQVMQSLRIVKPVGVRDHAAEEHLCLLRGRHQRDRSDRGAQQPAAGGDDR